MRLAHDQPHQLSRHLHLVPDAARLPYRPTITASVVIASIPFPRERLSYWAIRALTPMCRSLRLSVDLVDRHGPEDDAVILNVAVPQLEQAGQFFGSGGGQVVDLAGIT